MTLKVTGLSGFVGSRLPIVVVQTASAVDDTDQATAFTLSCDIGTATPARTVFVLIAAEENTTTGRSISTVTVNGVSASLVVAVSGAANSNSQIAEIWAATVPTGSGAQNIVVTPSGSVDGVAVETVACTGVRSLTAGATQTDTVTAGTPLLDAVTVAVSAGGIILAVSMAGLAGLRAADWTAGDLTESTDGDVGSEFGYSTARALYASSDTAASGEMAWSGSVDGAAVMAAMR